MVKKTKKITNTEMLFVSTELAAEFSKRYGEDSEKELRKYIKLISLITTTLFETDFLKELRKSKFLEEVEEKYTAFSWKKGKNCEYSEKSDYSEVEDDYE